MKPGLLSLKDNNGWTALQLAAKHGHFDSVMSILRPEVVYLNATDPEDITILGRAIEARDINGVKLLLALPSLNLRLQDDKQRSYLHVACIAGDPAILETLLDVDKFELSDRDIGGRTALSLAVVNDLGDATERILTRMVSVLDAQDNEGRVPLSYAAQHGCIPAILALVLQLAPSEDHVAVLDTDGRTVLHWAAGDCTGRALKCLLRTRYAAQLNTQDVHGHTPLHVAVYLANVAGCDILINTPGIDLNARDRLGHSALADAVLSNDVQICRILLAQETLDTATRDSKVRLHCFSL